MKAFYTRLILLLVDGISIVIAILLAFALRQWCDCFERSAPNDLIRYLEFGLMYGMILTLLYVEGIYTKRYDFWQELERTFKAILLSGVIVFAVLAMTKHSDSYSRFIIIMVFVILAILLPLQKYFIKRILFALGYWKHPAHLLGEDPFFEQHVYNNPYLGYIYSSRELAKTLFVSSSHSKEQIETILHNALLSRQEVIFIPAIKNFDFSDAHIIHIFNSRANLIIVDNNLINPFNRSLKYSLDYLLSIILFPLLVLLIGFIAWKIKREDGGTIFFKQERLGQNGKPFECYKFRSMRENSNALLKTYLQEHPEEVTYYNAYHKYINDPRITKIGSLLRKTSLDELPQIINVLKGEMSLIGPRPYMTNEKEKIGDSIDMILAVKPGVTGLWQVSGRSDVDFASRVDMDVWYVRNWSIWSDIIILIKTVQVVLGHKGSY
jgi:lipopolysaccharide/colanic/teichoic acid biosynthesis glycosyltransferase